MPLALLFKKLSPNHPFNPLRTSPPGYSQAKAPFGTMVRIIVGAVIALCLIQFASGAENSSTLAWDANPESDITGYVVYVGISSGQYPLIQDVGNVSSFALSGLSPTETYYCAVQAYNASGLTSELSAEISFSVQSATEIFDGWASSVGLVGANAVPSASPFHDGVSNLAKFAFNMNGAGPDSRTLVKGTGTAGLPVYALDRSGAQPAFVMEFLRRKSSGLVYTPRTSTNLGSFETMTGTTTVIDMDAVWERVVVRKTVSTTTTPRLFGRVDVTIP